MCVFVSFPSWLASGLAFHLSTQSVGMYSGGGVQLLFVMSERIADGEFAINDGQMLVRHGDGDGGRVWSGGR